MAKYLTRDELETFLRDVERRRRRSLARLPIWLALGLVVGTAIAVLLGGCVESPESRERAVTERAELAARRWAERMGYITVGVACMDEYLRWKCALRVSGREEIVQLECWNDSCSVIDRLAR